MLLKRIIPILLLKGNGLYKTVKFSSPRYVGDPMNAIKVFNDKNVDELVLLDITATKEGKKPDFNFISKVTQEFFLPLCYGGGVRTMEDIKKILRSGADKVAMNSLLIESPSIVAEAAKKFGSQSIVASIDASNNNGGIARAVQLALRSQSLGCGEILLQSVDKDGTMTGYDLDLVKEVCKSVDIPVIACGGADIVEHFLEVFKVGAHAVAAGSMFVFYGRNKAVLINYLDDNERKQVQQSVR